MLNDMMMVNLGEEGGTLQTRLAQLGDHIFAPRGFQVVSGELARVFENAGIQERKQILRSFVEKVCVERAGELVRIRCYLFEGPKLSPPGG